MPNELLWNERILPRLPRGDGCWEWPGALSDKGYGQVSFKIVNRGFKRLIHRIALEIKLGRPLVSEPKECSLHTCDNPKCCNPAHLFAGSRADNNKDRAAKKRNGDISGPKNKMCKTTSEEAFAIVDEYRTQGTAQRKLAKKYNLSKGEIWNMIHGLHWATRR